MNSSECIPVSKKKYVGNLIKLEAENKFLKKKIQIYEELINTKVKTGGNNYYKPHLSNPMKSSQLFSEVASTKFKKNTSNFLISPEKNENLINPIIDFCLNYKHYRPITEDNVKKFLHDF